MAMLNNQRVAFKTHGSKRCHFVNNQGTSEPLNKARDVSKHEISQRYRQDPSIEGHMVELHKEPKMGL